MKCYRKCKESFPYVFSGFIMYEKSILNAVGGVSYVKNWLLGKIHEAHRYLSVD